MDEPEQRTPRDAHFVVGLIRSLTFESQQYVDKVARHLGLHRSDVAAVGVLVAAARQRRTMSPGELARTMHMSAAAVSALVDRLARVGHVRRDRHATDGRMVSLECTEHGRWTSRQLFAPLREAQEAALAGYSPEELEIAARVIADLTAAAADASVRPLPPPLGE